MGSRSVLLGTASLVALAAAAWWASRGSADAPASSPEPTEPPPTTESPRPRPPEPSPPVARAPRYGTEAGRRARARMLERILRNLDTGAGTGPAKPPEAPPDERAETPGEREDERAPMALRVGGALPADYVQEVIRDSFVPLARDCFDLVLEYDPKFEGKTVVRFTIVADEGVGGVVESAEEVEGASTLPPEMGECLVESMMSLTFDAPGEGRGRTVVTYPFLFVGG